MIEAYGDLWTYPAQVRVITTNGDVKANGRAVMGRGCALEAAQRFPYLSRALGMDLVETGNHAYVFDLDNPPIITFPVKHCWREPASLILIEQSTLELVDIANRNGWTSIVMPRPGCGAGQLDWESQVRPILAPLLADRFTVLTFERPLAGAPSSVALPHQPDVLPTALPETPRTRHRL